MRIGCCAYSYRRYLTSGEMSLEDFIDLAVDATQDPVTIMTVVSCLRGKSVSTTDRPLAEGVDLEELARTTYGFVGADLGALARAVGPTGRVVGVDLSAEDKAALTEFLKLM